MTWGFLWLMLFLKIPIGMLLYLVWWAIKQSDMPETQPSDGDGGTKVPPHEPRAGRHPRRRGPHGEPVVPAPPRVRTTIARSREPEHG
jgi:hypothetical protein